MKAADLKNSILQLAISGRLVPQDPADEPASVLYEQIQAEKNRLIQEGKLKVSKKNCCTNIQEPPFEIPESWMWVKLGDIADLYTGDSISEIVKATKYKNLEIGYDYIGTKDVGFDNVITYNNGVKIPYDEKGFKYAYDTSILLCIEGGSAGRKIARLDKQVCFGNKLCSITPFGFENSFIYYFLQSDFFRTVFNEKNSGIIGGVSITKLFELAVPLPPLAEQKRIVEKIEKLEPLVNRYGKAAEELARLKSTFPDELRNSILQEAVSGRLVPQNPVDEPASTLYEQIQAEKKRLIKEGKIRPSKLPKLNEPLNPPFQIPDSWMWIKLGDIITLISGQDLTTNEYNAIGEGVPYITGASNIENDKVIINRWTNFPKSMAQKGDLLITCKGTVGLMAFLTVDKAHIARQIMAIRGNDYINLEYIKTYLLANITTLQSQAKSMIPGISRSNILYAIMPLPPIAEQNRIVDKVKSLDGLIDNLFKLVA